jgi:hypothetical protein
MSDNPRMAQGQTRRTFLKQSAVATLALSGPELVAAGASKNSSSETNSVPWYRRCLRWGQTNITELDVTRYDIPWWRDYWKRTCVQGIIVNAGGIVAYYPSKFPLHRRAQFLGERDLFGELLHAARGDGIAVLARMDSGGAADEFYHAHTDWFCVDSNGKPFRGRDLFIPCINGPYYREYMPDLLREIAERYHPEGFTDNSWSGPSRSSICHCENCSRKFREYAGKPLPERTDWEDPVYRKWIQWSYACRLEIWDLNNRVTREGGGPDCLWVGMNGGSIAGQAQSFRDYKAICERSEIVLLDHQSRSDSTGFQNNGESGKLIHGLLGWSKLIPESMAMYQAGRPTFRFTAKPAAEARLWMLDGFAGGIQPWWHHLGAFQEDRRMFHTAEPVMRWHRANEQFLINRQPIANIGVVWSQQNNDFYGRDEADLLVEQPWRGVTQALIRARIPYLPLHVDHLERDASQFSALILPNFGAMTDAQVATIRKFVANGGGLLATGETGLYDEWGDPRADFALADLFGAHIVAKSTENLRERRRVFSETQHTYLRLMLSSQGHEETVRDANGIERRKVVPARHPALRGFEETDLLPFGGNLRPLRLDPNTEVPLTLVPPFPVYPPEFVWMREPQSDTPGLILRESAKTGGASVPASRPGGRVAFLPADLDRRFARDNLPDHANLLANLIRWVSRDNAPLRVAGTGLIDCHLYRRTDHLILHVINLTNAGTWRAPVEELISIGPFHVQVPLPKGIQAHNVRLLVSGDKHRLSAKDGWLSFEIKSILDHEVAVLS